MQRPFEARAKVTCLRPHIDMAECGFEPGTLMVGQILVQVLYHCTTVPLLYHTARKLTKSYTIIAGISLCMYSNVYTVNLNNFRVVYSKQFI